MALVQDPPARIKSLETRVRVIQSWRPGCAVLWVSGEGLRRRAQDGTGTFEAAPLDEHRDSVDSILG